MKISFPSSRVALLGAPLFFIANVLAQPTTSTAPKPAANFTAPSREYSVWMPGKPKIETSEEAVEGMTRKMKVQTASDESTDVVYFVVPTDFSPLDLTTVPKAPLYAEHEKAFAGELKGKIVSKRELKWAGQNAREIIVDAGDVRFQMRLTFGKTRMFQAFAGGLKSDLVKNKASVNKFFDSMRILKP